MSVEGDSKHWTVPGTATALRRSVGVDATLSPEDEPPPQRGAARLQLGESLVFVLSLRPGNQNSWSRSGGVNGPRCQLVGGAGLYFSLRYNCSVEMSLWRIFTDCEDTILFLLL